MFPACTVSTVLSFKTLLLEPWSVELDMRSSGSVGSCGGRAEIPGGPGNFGSWHWFLNVMPSGFRHERLAGGQAREVMTGRHIAMRGILP